VGQLAKQITDHHSGSFSTNIQVNPKEQCKAIITISGKELRLSEEVRNMIGESESVEEETKKLREENVVEKEKKIEK